jgi:hypothetical protein
MRASSTVGLPPVAETAEEKRRRQRKLLRLKYEVQEQVRTDIEKEAVKLNDAQGDVDLHIDRVVKGRLQIFVMVGGILGGLALALCIVGLITREATSVVGASGSDQSIATQLAGYPTWTAFTSGCCCTGHMNPTGHDSNLWVEKWICANGRIKERVRAIGSGGATGFAIRTMCNVTFEAGCSVTVSSGMTQLSCSTVPTASEAALW